MIAVSQGRILMPATMSIANFGGLFVVLLLLPSVAFAAANANAKQLLLCADESGNFVGLATDVDAYESVPGPPSGEKNEPAQSWKLTAEGTVDPHNSNNGGSGPRRSYDGRFLQVLPDSGRSYPKRGTHLERAEELDGTSPYVSFKFRVDKKKTGIHTLFVRWTGGDTVGAGDSLYVVLYKRGKKGAKKTLVTGEQTVKPIVRPIESTMSRYAGCCYDMETHACPCYEEQPDDAVCKNDGFVERRIASQYGVQCPVGNGAVEIVKAPQWYLFAGQEAGSVMDFDEEPWDATCEADGSNTKDSGHDFPSWVLDDAGEYELRMYAREDGTALDGIYIAGPSGHAPSISKQYERGDSTLCSASSSAAATSNTGKTLLVASVGVGLVALAYYVFVGRRETEFGAMMSMRSGPAIILEQPLQTITQPSLPADSSRYMQIEQIS